MQKTILTLFGFNIENFPDNSFIEDLPEVNIQGALINNYSKIFRDKTYALFDTIEIKHFGNCFNVFFKSHKLNKINLYGLRKLINDLYKIYGPDSNGKGKYNTQDFRDLNHKEFSLFNRFWNMIENEKLLCDLSNDKELNTLTLVIYGIGLSKT